MSKSKQQIYCSYMQYLDDHYPKFHEFINRTCSRRSLRLPKDKGLSGITLLIPANNGTEDEIEKLLYGFDEGDLEKAGRLIKSCIIYGHLPKVQDWKNNQEDIISSLGTKLLVKSITDSKIILESGAELVPDEKFRTTEKSATKVAIWLIKKGVPNASETPAEYKFAAKKMGSFRGSHEEIKRILNRDLYFKSIMCSYHQFCENQKSGKEKYRLPLLEFSASLIDFVHKNNPEFLPDIMSLCNMGFSDIFFMLEPGCMAEPILPDNVIDSWWSSRKSAPVLETYRRAFEAVRDSAACFSKRNEIISGFDLFRKNNPAGVDTFDQLVKIYQTLSQSNSLFGVTGIFPKRIAARYQKDPCLKINEDDRRFFWEVRLLDYEKNLAGSGGELNNIIDTIMSFHEKRGILTFVSTFVINTNRVKSGLTDDPLNNLIIPVYHSNLAVYIPGFEKIPGYVYTMEGAKLGDKMDMNFINRQIIERFYADVTPDLWLLDRMALQCLVKDRFIKF